MESDYWRTLLDVTNAVVTKRDLGELRAAIAPNVRRIVPHDHTNLFVIDTQPRLQSFVIDPTALLITIRPRRILPRFLIMRFPPSASPEVMHALSHGFARRPARRSRSEGTSSIPQPHD